VPSPAAPGFRPPTSPPPQGARFGDAVEESGFFAGQPDNAWADDEPAYGGYAGGGHPDGGYSGSGRSEGYSDGGYADGGRAGAGYAERHWTDDEPSFGGPSQGNPGWSGDPGWQGHQQDRPGGGDPAWEGDQPWSNEAPDYGPSWPDPDADPDADHADPQRPHKRRADVTAVDLGYTGRRSRSDHSRPENQDDYRRHSGERW
jgi:hypothetical protein